MNAAIPVYVCSLCPTDQDAFYCRSAGELTEHLRDEHLFFPKSFFHSIPLAEAMGQACRDCGMPCDDKLDGWCGWCFQARFSD